MGWIKYFLWISIFCIFIKISFSNVQEEKQRIRFQYLTTDDGLAQNTVDCILKDSRGFMWFGTWNGLSRFDGYSFKTYQKDVEPLGLPNNFIFTLCEDTIGNLWIGTGHGLVLFNFLKEKFISVDNFSNNIGQYSINTIIRDNRNRFWIGTQNNGLWLVGQDEYNNFNSYNINNSIVAGQQINDAFLEDEKKLLVGTNTGISIINLDDLDKKNTEYISLIQALENISVQVIFKDSENLLWLGTDEGLYNFNAENNQINFFGAENNNPNDLTHLTVTAISEDKNGNLIVGTLEGLNYYNHDNNLFTHLPVKEELNENLNNPFVSSLFADNSGNMWIGTEKGGANYYSTYQKPFYSIVHDNANINSISHNTINSILIENENLWIGTAGGGLNRITEDGQQITRFEMDPGNENSISSNFVTSIIPGSKNNLWVATWGGGLNVLNRTNPGRFTIFENQENISTSLCNNFISSLVELNTNKILLGTRGGLDVFRSDLDDFIHVHEKMGLDYPLAVGCLLIDKKERVWVGSQNGLYRFEKNDVIDLTADTEKIEFESFFNYPGQPESLAGDYVISLIEDKNGTVWIGTYGNGFCKFVEENEQEFFIGYNENDGLCNNVVYSMECDKQGNIWIITDNGLSKFNQKEEIFQNYFTKDGLPGNQFYWGASFADNSGRLYFGGINGLSYFHPEEIEIYPNEYKPVFTEFSVFNNPVQIDQKYHSKIILNQSVSETDKVELSYKDAVFSIEFSALDYFLPEKIKYAYKMEGVDQDWVIVPSNRRFANYTNLSGGEYYFRVKVANSDGVWSEQISELQVVIHPPFWQTAWFRILFVLAVILMVMGYIRYRINFLNQQRKKLEKQVQERTQKIEEQKAELEKQAGNLIQTNQLLAERQELIEGQKIELEKQNKQITSQRDEVIQLNKKVNLVNQLRLRFFTNISHEFRTPLTLIIDPIEQLILKLKADKETIRTLKIIDRNAQRLLHLINQLIYFRRIETGKLTLKVTKSNLTEFLKNIFETFQDLATHQEIDFSFNATETPDETWFDAEKMENIFYNLLSNAFKFTPSKGKIEMNVRYVLSNTEEKINTPFVSIEISDSGKGIAKKNLDSIFDRYYQESDAKDSKVSGSGIGLAITDEIVKALHGKIKVESKIGKGTVFKVMLPYTKNRFKNTEVSSTDIPVDLNIETRVEMLSDYIYASETDPEKEEDANSDRSKPLVLIVEDNFDLRNFLLQTLKIDYRVLGADNGKTGMEMAKSYSPELIISDVMMPIMDGLELCSRLKKDIRTSHIPIILLTAKNMLENWIEGLETGADDYIPKPFNFQILQAKMANLIESRRKLKRMFSQAEPVSVSEVTTNDMDAAFMEKAYFTLEENYRETEFSVNRFAEEMLVSQSLLYKKIKALTGLNITDFINSYKLNKAIERFKTEKVPVSEIAYQVGFNDPKYFSRIFRKFYGMTPSEFIKNTLN